MSNRTNIWNINHNALKLCPICAIKFSVKWSHLKRRKCCSIDCSRKYRKVIYLAEKNPNWKGGREKRSGGYITIRIGGKRIFEHVLIWTMINGKIPDKYIIHHKNGIKTDNRIENLECMSISDHMKYHSQKRKGDKGRYTIEVL